MDNFQLVLPEHLNHYGYLFGGILLKWVDESAYIAARIEYPGRSFVTVGMKEVRFKKQVESGSILRFHTKEVKSGNTSVTYQVSVYTEENQASEEQEIFTTSITFVCIDKEGNKRNLTDPE